MPEPAPFGLEPSGRNGFPADIAIALAAARCKAPAMDRGVHADRHFEVDSYYSLPEDAWLYELVETTADSTSGPGLRVLIPDATPIGPFTPQPADAMLQLGTGGEVPWSILRRFIDLIESSGDVDL